MNVSLEQLYLAYRKAKKEAFGDTNCAHGLKFLKYEQALAANLSRLRKILNRRNPKWHGNIEFIGKAACIPKSVTPPTLSESIHCQSSDPLEQWRSQCATSKADADFRPVIDATVDFMITSALWVLEVGHLYDSKLDTRYAVGNRLRRWRPKVGTPKGSTGKLNTLSPDLFQPYYTAYGKWRSAGLKAMRQDLESGHRIVAITMDLRRFYHEVNADFLLRENYLEELGLTLNEEQTEFTRFLITAFETWNQAANVKFGCGLTGLPVGLTASGLIANVLLQQFDRTVVSNLAPTYYARYVDDVFLVIRRAEPFATGHDFLCWLGERLNPIATTVDEGGELALQVTLPYGDGSNLYFVGKKQKIFQLEGPHGIDLIGPIEEQIRLQTSEYRDLPDLPNTESQMAHRALLVTSDATLDADALRKADAVTLRRSGFAMLLGDVEAHVRDLEPASWLKLRRQFYELAYRHLLTPVAFFNYARYYPRIVGVMTASRDWEYASRFIRGFKNLLLTIQQTCTAKTNHLNRYLEETCSMLSARMIEAILQCITRDKRQIVALIRQIRKELPTSSKFPVTRSAVTEISEQLLRLDWSRNSYALFWLDAKTNEEFPPKPKNPAILRQLPFPAIRIFRRHANLHAPHWPALAFPTRPIALREITSRAPSILHDGSVFSEVVRGLRGTWMPDFTGLRVTPPGDDRQEVHVPNWSNSNPKVAITSFEVSDDEWHAVADGTPRLTLDRYRRLNSILDSVATEKQRPDYVILPECSLPRRWAMQMATKVLLRGVSVIAGLEYRHDSDNPNLLHNEALVALKTNFSGYQTGLFLLQPKQKAAWHERQVLADSFNKSLAPLAPSCLNHPVYRHQNFCFGVLICSELTDIKNRLRFQGKVDAMFVPEWNQDVESFAALIESAALDVHAYIVQANNRRFGDSRIRAPMKVRYQRDIIRLTGGLNDYFVVGQINYAALRRFQSHSIPPTGEGVIFKPFPIGFPDRLAPNRRTTPMSG